MRNVFKIGFLLILSAGFSPARPQAGQVHEEQSKPKFYLAARAELRTPDQVWMRGLTNLPAASKLSVSIDDYIGQGSKTFSREEVAIVAADGTFNVEVRAKQGLEFQRNFVCTVAFFPEEQSPKVSQVVGSKGENLGFPKNPLVHVAAGDDYYLELVTVVTE